MEIQDAKQARPHCELIAELLDSRQPKTEREHAAVREIERLRHDIERHIAMASELATENEALRAELAQCQQEMQQIRQMGDTIPLPVCEAYGELWMTVTKNKRINRARHLLVSCMTMEERKAGMRLAMKAHNNATPAPITARKGEGE